MTDPTSPTRLRLFIAIPLPEPVKDEIEKGQAELRRALANDAVRWTNRTQFHLTLKFLGNVDEQCIGPLTDSLRGACADFPVLPLRAERIGFFPDSRYPRVIWAGVHDERDILPKLQLAIDGAVAGFTREKSEETFTGHVTLGRAKAIKRPQAEILARLAQGMTDRLFGEWTANTVELIRSELASGGARYSTLAAAPLAGGTAGREKLI